MSGLGVFHPQVSVCIYKPYPWLGCMNENTSITHMYGSTHPSHNARVYTYFSSDAGTRVVLHAHPLAALDQRHPQDLAVCVGHPGHRDLHIPGLGRAGQRVGKVALPPPAPPAPPGSAPPGSTAAGSTAAGSTAAGSSAPGGAAW